MDDSYPSTDEEQAVRLDFPYPDAREGLTRWMPLVKWLLAIPHFIVLFFLTIAAFVCVVIAWFAILFTGRYPRGLFDFVLDAGAGACASRPTHPSWPRTAIQPFSEPVRALRHVSLVSRQRTPRPQGAPALRARRSCTADSRRP
jgi:hypothetical protein